VMGSVILIGVLADQQFTRYRERRAGLRGDRALDARETERASPAE
jgi:hypothetical protein